MNLKRTTELKSDQARLPKTLARLSLARLSKALILSAAFTGAAVSTISAEETPALSTSNSLAGNYLAARIASTDRDTQNAATFYRKVIGLDGKNADLKFKGLMSFIANGDFAEGVALGRELAKDGEEPEVVSIVLAVDDLRSKNWAGAERMLDKEWRSALDRLMAGLVLGWVKIGQDKPEEAVSAVDALQGPAWFDLFARYHSGLIAMAAGKDEDAVRKLNEAFENRAGGRAAADTYQRVILALAHAHLRNKNPQEARKVAQSGLQQAPQNPVFMRFLSELDSGKTPKFAVTTAQRGAAEVFINLGTALDREGGVQFAQIYLQLARVLAEKDDAVAVELAEFLDKQGSLHAANALFKGIAETSPYHRVARLEIALNMDELDDLEAARTEMDKLIKSDPDDLVALLSYGAVLARHEKYHDAINVYDGAIQRIRDPQRVHWNLYYRQGIGYERTKQWPKAEAAFKKALELFPDQPSVLNYLGYSWVDMNINLEEGLEMIRTAVRLRPNDGYMVDSLGWAYYRLKRFDEAVKELERAVELRPGDPTINDHLGDAYWKTGRKLEATFQWKHALALDPPDGGAGRIEDKLESGLDAVEEKELARPEDEKPDNG